VYFLFAQGHGNAQNLSFTSLVHAHSNQDSRISDLPILAYFFVAGIQVEVTIGA
jgi:hypothetical protein